VLRAALPSSGSVLEVASGSGEHIVHFARALPAIDWQPSDPDSAARASIDAWVDESGLGNVRPALAIDAAAAGWPIDRTDAILCINMVHISPWAATLGLLANAGRLLPSGGLLYLYGPYLVSGAMTPSNADFDDDLRRRDPAWGVRDLEAVTAAAADHALRLDRVVEMPANNLSVLLRRD
jgi:SAM-dependent methyltransferase